MNALMGFPVYGGDDLPKGTREEDISDNKAGFKKIKEDTKFSGRPVYIDGILSILDSNKFTMEELDLTVDDVSYLREEQIKNRKRTALKQKIEFLKMDIMMENRKLKLFRSRKLLREKATEIKSLLENSDITHEEVGLDQTFISDLTN